MLARRYFSPDEPPGAPDPNAPPPAAVAPAPAPVAAAPVVTPDPAPDPLAGERARLEADRQGFEAMRAGIINALGGSGVQDTEAAFLLEQAKRGDAYAIGLVRMAQAQAQREAVIDAKLELSEIEDRGVRTRTRELLETGDYRTVEAARLAALGEAAMAPPPPSPAPPTVPAAPVPPQPRPASPPSTFTRPVSAAEHAARTVTLQEYTSRITDPNIPIAERIALKQEAEANPALIRG